MNATRRSVVRALACAVLDAPADEAASSSAHPGGAARSAVCEAVNPTIGRIKS